MDPDKLISQYALNPKRLDKALHDLVELQLNLAQAAEKWTIRQIAHHRVDADELWKTCTKAALASSGCTMDLSWYILDNKCVDH